MAKKKKKQGGGGAPDWMVTYGDMMTLLLCFFVLIVSFSTIQPEQKEKYEAAIESVKKALGMPEAGRIPSDEVPKMSMIQMLERIRQQQEKHENEASTDVESVKGEQTEVRKLRPGMQFAVGGPITFAPGSAELSSEARRSLRRIAELARGYNNLIELRGHAASMELSQAGGAPYDDLWQLSHARAQAAMSFLTGTDIGMRPERFRLIAVAEQEPMTQRAYNPRQQAVNRRVEVVVGEGLTRDSKGN